MIIDTYVSGYDRSEHGFDEVRLRTYPGNGCGGQYLHLKICQNDKCCEDEINTNSFNGGDLIQSEDTLTNCMNFPYDVTIDITAKITSYLKPNVST